MPNKGEKKQKEEGKKNMKLTGKPVWKQELQSYI